MKKIRSLVLLPVVAVVLSACSSADLLKNSFQARGIATLDRLNQDQANAECAVADATGKPLDAKMTQAIEAASMKTVKWPTDGKFLGDWKEGEKIAQSGRGLILYTGAAEWQQHSQQVEGVRDQYDGVKVQLLSEGPLGLYAQQLPSAAPINLLQGAYAPQAAAHGGWRAWRAAVHRGSAGPSSGNSRDHPSSWRRTGWCRRRS